MSYSNVRDPEVLGSLVGKRVVDITQHDPEEFAENGESRIYLHFENGTTLSFPIGDEGFDLTDVEGGSDGEEQ